MTTTIKVDPELIQLIVIQLTSDLESIKAIKGLTYALTFQPYPRSLLEYTIRHGENSLSLHPSDGPLVMILIYATWSEKSDDLIMVNTQREFVAEIESSAHARHSLSRIKLMNYAFKGQDVINGYGPSSRERLLKASAKYDPTGFFQKVVPGGFKIL